MSAAAAGRSQTATAKILSRYRNLTISQSLQELIDKYAPVFTEKAPVDKMYEKFNVRMAPFDQERISLFEGLLSERPTEVPPVFVLELPDGRLLILDGRTRDKAAKNLKIKTISALIFKNVTEADRILIASLANLGGSRDMKQPDLKLTFDNLLQAGTKESQIKLMFAGILPKRTIYYALQISSRDRRKRATRQARKDVANGMSIMDAAKKNGIQVAKLKAAIRGGGDSTPIAGREFQGEMGELGLKCKSFKQSLTTTATRWMVKHSCDELETDNVTDLYAKARGHAKEILQLVDTAEEKFKNHIQNGETTP